ncbi:hypothetical protein H2198_003366 [Neophaeococcomyces mojaviensis]|uniref:Uncharacterized protein n=1 Tax=Neophaeococcomyces mojaviensis TaxID=3383035 RepID=A0ACC3ABP0_9EURO|nr:hypothetical protein H2198_003366 [Knufia sp. JES_112]
MARHASLAIISNSLATSKQVLELKNRDATTSVVDANLFKTSLLTQFAGLLLHLPQEVIATSIIILQRFLVSSASIATEIDLLTTSQLIPEASLVSASAASVYLSAKQSFYPLSPRSIINVYALLTSPEASLLSFINSNATGIIHSSEPPNSRNYHVSEGAYETHRQALFDAESRILASLAFDTKVVLPHTLALTYMQALSASTVPLAERVLAHLNAALLSPQLLYLTHQPNALAVAAIYLAAREQEVALVDDEVAWWEVFDVGREGLGFLVLSMGSLNGFVEAEKVSWTGN